jgi:hypothetical protein
MLLATGCCRNARPRRPGRAAAQQVPRSMLWLMLESVFALLLFVFIVWWTLPRKRDRDKED